MKTVRVLLADDHRLFAQGVAALLPSEFELVGIVSDGRALSDEALRLKPDLIVADIAMPSLNGIDAVEQLKKAGSEAKIIFLTMHKDAAYASRAFEAGAAGFLLKHSASDELLTAIRAVLRGRTYVTPAIAGELMEAYKDGSAAGADPIQKLTPRQREVLQLVAEGKSAKEIAAQLHISPRTAEFHKYQIMEALGLRNSAELVHFAIKNGIISI